MGCILFGIKVNVIGELVKDKPVLLVANHISWADILALGSVANISFIAKSEIKKWPLIGFLASLQKTIFVERSRKKDSKRASNEMANRLASGNALVLFAEGGSDIGAHILPFRSALVGAAQNAMNASVVKNASIAKSEGIEKNKSGAKQILIQPVTIAYIKLQGLQVSRGDRMQLAWNRSNSALQNIKQVLRRSVCEITISFAEPIVLGKDENRKIITKKCHAIVRKTHNELTRGSLNLAKNKA